MLLYLAAIVSGLALLVWAADRFVLGAEGLSRIAGIPPLIIGMVVIGFGTSAPELAVSTLASLQGSASLAVGNAVGSNIANIGLIVGVCALARPLTVQSSALRRELPMVLAAAVLLQLLVMDGQLGRVDGSLLAAGLALFIGWSLRRARRGGSDLLAIEVEAEAESQPALAAGSAWLWTIIGLLLLLGASQLLIWGATQLALGLGVSELVIGLTVVAIGTSLPELAAGLTSVLKGQDDLAVGNVLGSNLFNILAILIAPAWLAPGTPLDQGLVWRDVPMVILMTLLLWASAAGLRGARLRVERVDGAVLLAVFVAYTLILANSAIAASVRPA